MSPPLQDEHPASTDPSRTSPVPAAHLDVALPSQASQASASRTASVASSEGSRVGAWASMLLGELASQDWVIAAYLILVLFALAIGNGPGREECAQNVMYVVLMYVTGMALTRGKIFRPGSFWHGFSYRATVFCSVFLSYFQLQKILPAVSGRAVDAQIYNLDMRIFHVEPSVAWDRFVTPQTVEWFAFFYFGYFFLLALHVLPIMLAAKDMDVVSHFCLGIFLVFLPGHLIYMMVPGFGPYKFLAGEFHNELHGGLFWALVRATVDSSGAQKDIFPSIHTAAPTFFAIFSWYHRDNLPFRFTWFLVAAFASQIIIATMFLRWHYLIDIFAGFALATFAAVVSRKVTIWEHRVRASRGKMPSFQPLSWREALGS